MSWCLGNGRTLPCPQHHLRESERCGEGEGGRAKGRDLGGSLPLTKSRDGAGVERGDRKKNELLQLEIKDRPSG